MQACLAHGRRPPDGPAQICHTGAKRTQQALSRSRAPVFQAPGVTAKSLLHIRTQTHRLLSLATSRSSPDLLGGGSRSWKGDRKVTAATTAPGLTPGPVPVLPRPWSLRMAEGHRSQDAGRPSNPATPSSAAVIHSANTAEQPPAPFARSPSMKAGGSPAFSEVTGQSRGSAHTGGSARRLRAPLPWGRRPAEPSPSPEGSRPSVPAGGAGSREETWDPLVCGGCEAWKMLRAAAVHLAVSRVPGGSGLPQAAVRNCRPVPGK